MSLAVGVGLGGFVMNVQRISIRIISLMFLLFFAGCGPDDKEMPIAVDSTPPTVSSVSPDNATSGNPVNTNVTVFFSERVTPGTVTITLTSPGGLAIVGITTVSGNLAIFNPTTNLVSTSNYSVSLAPGFEDLQRNAQSTGLSWTFSTGTTTDGAAPTISTRSPAVGAVGVATDVAVNVTFSEDMDPDTINASTFYVTGVAGTVSYNVATKTATWTQASPPLAENTTYTVNISGAQDLSKNALANTNWTFTTSIVSLPAAPSGLGATTVSSTQIDLTWTDVSGNETGFSIERKTGVGGTYAQIATVGASVTSYSNTGLAEGTNYYYQVRAYNGIGNSGYSNEANASTPPIAPSGLSAAAITDVQVDLVWTDNSSVETLFSIERKTGAAGIYAEIDTVGTNTATYSDLTALPETIYYYRVRAYDGSTYSSYTTEANTTMGPAAPSVLSATATGATQIDLAWTDNATTETLFSIERKTGAAGTYAVLTTVAANTIVYSDTSVVSATTYYYRIRAYNGSVYSTYSNEDFDTTP